MSTQKKWMSSSVATAVAIAFMAIPYTPALANTNSELVICPGVNACKGKSACAVPSGHCGEMNRCRGKNACKGQGFLMLSKAECVKRGSHGIKYVSSADVDVSQPSEK